MEKQKNIKLLHSEVSSLSLCFNNRKHLFHPTHKTTKGNNKQYYYFVKKALFTILACLLDIGEAQSQPVS
jgi:hypothetical protein